MACLFALLVLMAALLAEGAERPSMVVILSDDMGYSDIGCYGGEIDTPHLDALAENGLRFTQFYNTGRCCPTRASLMTGLHPHQAGMGHMTEPRKTRDGEPMPGYTGGINRPCVTIPEVLGAAGYRTYMSGKWHVTQHKLSPDGPKHNWPIQRGFDRFYGTLGGGGSFYDPSGLCRGNQWVTPYTDAAYQPWGDRRPASGEYYYTDAISDNAVAFLEDHEQRHADAPFFLYIAYTAPHWPMHALPEDIAKYEGRFDAGYETLRRERFERMNTLGVLPAGCELSKTVGRWGAVGDRREWELRCMEVYAAMVDRMDRGIGQIIEALRRQGRLDNTLVLYLQDNGGCAENKGRRSDRGLKNWPKAAGEPLPDDHFFSASSPPLRDRTTGKAHVGYPAMPGPPGTFIGYGRDWANVSNTPFRWFKHYVHEGGIATPLVAHWPAGIAARGELRRQPSHLIDLMATCVDISDADYPSVYGERAIPPIEGVSLRPAFDGDALDRESLYWEHEGHCAVRTGDWKLVRLRGDNWELYDLSADRAELRDLAADEPDRVEAMAADWRAWAERSLVFPSPFLD